MMAAFTRSLITVSSVILLLFHLVSAQECNLQNVTNFEYEVLYVSSQDDLDIPELQGCTTIVGSISIKSNYTGSFVLSGISNITYDISAYNDDGNATDNTHITSIEMNDLTHLRDLYLSGTPDLTTIDFPKLSTVNDLSIEGNQLSNINFRSLLNATWLTISGNITSMNFPLLAEVFNALNVGSSSLSDFYTGHRRASTPLDITFPSLWNASAIYLTGNISNISMPSLINAHQTSDSDGLRIETYNLPLDVSFPILSDLEGIELSGAFESLSFPSLANLSGDFTLDSDLPLALNLSNFIRINGSVSIGGNITSVAFPNLDFLTGNLDIFSYLPLSCSDAGAAWERVNASSTKTWGSFTCEGTPKRKSYPSKLTLGLGIGLGVGIPFMVFFVWFVRRESEKEKKKGALRKDGALGGVELETEVGNSAVDGDREYESGGETERGSIYSEDTAVEALREGDGRVMGTGDVRSGEDGVVR